MLLLSLRLLYIIFFFETFSFLGEQGYHYREYISSFDNADRAIQFGIDLQSCHLQKVIIMGL